jgi:hypothetical protein
MEARREAQAVENVLKVTPDRGCVARRPTATTMGVRPDRSPSV